MNTAALAAALAVLPAAAAGETESFWIAQGGSFHEPANWDGPVPEETVTAIFDLVVEPYLFVNFDGADAVSSRMVVRSGDLFFVMWDSAGEDVVSRHYDMVNASFQAPSLVVAEGDGARASLFVSEGFLAAQSMVIAQGTGSEATVDFSSGLFDLSAGLACTYQLHVGGAGAGTLLIDNPTDQETVAADEVVLGVGAGSSGDVLVSGPATRLDASGPLTAGRQGSGTLTVENLADVTSASAIIGQQPDASGVVTLAGQGATWTIDGNLDVGFQGAGTLGVTGGAAVFTQGWATIGTFPGPGFDPQTGGVGDVTVGGPASLWLVETSLDVGLAWEGTLEVADGATVTSQWGRVDGGSMAALRDAGSVWSMIDDLEVAGTLAVRDGARVFAGGVDLLNTLAIGLAGAAPSAYGAVVAGGDATLGGTLAVTLADGYTPALGDAFTVVTGATVSGIFSDVVVPALPPELAWLVVYEPAAVVVLVTTPGDLDGDGIVGITDFLILLAAWGPCPGEYCPADLDGDGVVGITDFLALLMSWDE